jgi:transposase InsO family protein
MLMVRRLASGWTVAAVARAQGASRPGLCANGVTVTPPKVRRGLPIARREPHRNPRRLTAPIEAEIVALRRQRLTAPAIARHLHRPVSTVGHVLRRAGLGRLAALDPKPTILRCQRETPGELIHIDIKKLSRIDGIGHRITGNRTGQSNKRGTGWEYVHVAVDDASRLAYTELLATERKESAVPFTARAIEWFATHGVIVERIMTDNGSAYKSFAFRDLLAERGIKHKRTRPYTPRTNGKAERFIQTSLRESAYTRAFESSATRHAAMLLWITDYNSDRPHSALGGKSPIKWIAELHAASATTPPDTADAAPSFVGVAGVKPRAATAAGGLGLTPDRTDASTIS